MGLVSCTFSSLVPANVPFRVEQNIVIIAPCIPTVRPFFHRTWKRGVTTTSGSHSRSLAIEPFTSATEGRSRFGCQAGSISDVALNPVEGDVYSLGKAVDGDDAASFESHQGIIKTVEVSMNWDNDTIESGTNRNRGRAVSHCIADAQ